MPCLLVRYRCENYGKAQIYKMQLFQETTCKNAGHVQSTCPEV
jgi:hypothetical protein